MQIRCLNKLYDFFNRKLVSAIYYAALFLLAALIAIFNVEVAGVVVFVLIISAVLVVSNDLTDILYPTLLVAVFSTRCYNSFNTFMSLWYIALFPIAAIVFFLIKSRQKLQIGASFYGIAAVTVSVTLGGAFTLPISDYFGAAYYVFGLGALMLLLYLAFKPRIGEEQKNKLLLTMLLVGLFASFCVYRFYLADLAVVIETKKLLSFQSSNNLSTMIMICLPFAFYFSVKRLWALVFVPIMFFALLLAGSRGGLVMGTIELFILFIIYIIITKGAKDKIAFSVLFAAFAIVGIVLAKKIFEFYGFSLGGGEDKSFAELLSSLFSKIISSGEARAKLIGRSFTDFLQNPVFGVGLGYKGNADLYNPVKGAMNWYHMWAPQVIGGLGILGILCYGFQLCQRVWLMFKNKSLENWTFFCGYLGLFLMSQVNPGEFCPLPYCALGVLFFIAIEHKQSIAAEPKTEAVDGENIDSAYAVGENAQEASAEEKSESGDTLV